MSIEKIKALFQSAGKQKIEFKPEVKVVLPSNATIWVDNIFQNRGQLMMTVSTLSDKTPMYLDNADQAVIHATAVKLHAEYGSGKF